MNAVIKVDENKCLSDGLCIADCPAQIIEADTNGYPRLVDGGEEYCIDCGHCVAVCPVQALDQRQMAAKDCLPIQPEHAVAARALEQHLQARRSVRQYRPKLVPESDILRLLEIVAYAPSGHNQQPTRWLVFSGRDRIRELASLVADWMRGLTTHQPKVAQALHLHRVIEAWDGGRDRILRQAPHLLVAYAASAERTAPTAVATAIAHLEIVAPTLGLGTCWAGYFAAACRSPGPLLELVALPEDHQVFGAVLLGYPDVEYHLLPKRHAVDVQFRHSDPETHEA